MEPGCISRTYVSHVFIGKGNAYAPLFLKCTFLRNCMHITGIFIYVTLRQHFRGCDQEIARIVVAKIVSGW